MIVHPGNGAVTGYNLQRSIRLRASASASLSRTPASAGNQQKWTWSGWVKRGSLSTDQRLFASSDLVSLEGFFQFNANNTFTYSDINSLALTTTQVFRDTSAWYHIVVALDTTQATASNRVLIYVNGQQVTSFTSASYPAQNSNEFLNRAVATRIGSAVGNNIYFDGYLSEVNFIDGQALTPSSFGSTNATTGVWQPAPYTGTYGTNGFYLPFTDNSALTTSSNVGLGKDFSGNGNYWTTNNISITSGVTYDSMTDVPTLTDASTSNFCTANPLSYGQACSPTPMTMSGGNLNWTYNRSSSGSTFTVGTMQIPVNGKIYFEAANTSYSTANGLGIGVSNIPSGMSNPTWLRIINLFDGKKSTESVATAYGTAYGAGDICGCAIDFVNGKIFFSKNGVWQGSGDPVAGTNAAFTDLVSSGYTLLPLISGAGGDSNTGWVNFGQRPFAYTPPTGFVALNAYNLPADTITTSGSFTGNVNVDGPSINLNGVPTAMTINGNAVTFGTHADKTAYGFKVRSSSSSYNSTGTNTYSVTSTGAKFKYANAQGNP